MTDNIPPTPPGVVKPYHETYRPQFHFTAEKNWLNDPNGLFYYESSYHLFFQHNPTGNAWGNMTWGHAVSNDLVHWQQNKNALEPDELGTMYSGSAVVDWHNTSGFGTSTAPPLVLIYTAAGNTSPASQGKPFTQCLAYSNDRGRTWTKYAGNPVLAQIADGNRDPKVVWYAPTRRWIMALYLDKADFAFYASPDLKVWQHLQTMTVPGCDECPDFFEMPVEKPGIKQGESHQGGRVGETLAGEKLPGEKPSEEKSAENPAEKTKWVWTAANGHYLVGSFAGSRFTPETPLLQPDYGANYYAVQTYSDIPPHDGRRIQIAWMRGGEYPEMPFNQQMSFPCELTLHDTLQGLRLFRQPVREIQSLYQHTFRLPAAALSSEEKPLPELKGDLWDIEAEFEVQTASEFGVRIGGERIIYSVAQKILTCLSRSAPLEPHSNHVKIRVLVDRTSLEVFGNDGIVSLTSCFLPKQEKNSAQHMHGIGLFATGGTVKLIAFAAHTLRSAWKP